MDAVTCLVFDRMWDLGCMVQRFEATDNEPEAQVKQEDISIIYQYPDMIVTIVSTVAYIVC